MKTEINIFWFRRDLRFDDNTGLLHALKAGRPVLPLFVFDTSITDPLDRIDARVELLHQEPHLVAKMPDHELWMAFFHDPDENLLALMSEVRA